MVSLAAAAVEAAEKEGGGPGGRGGAAPPSTVTVWAGCAVGGGRGGEVGEPLGVLLRVAPGKELPPSIWVWKSGLAGTGGRWRDSSVGLLANRVATHVGEKERIASLMFGDCGFESVGGSTATRLRRARIWRWRRLAASLAVFMRSIADCVIDCTLRRASFSSPVK